MYAMYGNSYEQECENGAKTYYSDQNTNEACIPQNHFYTTSSPQCHPNNTSLLDQSLMKQQFNHQLNNMPPSQTKWPSSQQFQTREALPMEANQSLENSMKEVSIQPNNNALDNNTGSAIKQTSPMCLVNELGKFNKITHQYTLTNEEGPAHKKVFSVSLKLGVEEFSSTGASIKKAQRAAASEALMSTSYTKPLHKKQQINLSLENKNPSLPPTVQLNSLAMKQGKTVVYRVVSNTNPPYHPHYNNYQNNHPNNQDNHPNNQDNQRTFPKNNTINFGYFRNNEDGYSQGGVVEMEVEVDGVVYRGQGNRMKQAKSACATAALEELKKNAAAAVVEAAVASDVADGGSEDKPVTARNNNKSEISLIYEMAYKRQMAVNFTVSKESGPAHMKTYQTTCTCGDLKMLAEGNSKKDSKKHSAAGMLLQLQQLPALPEAADLKTNKKAPKKTKAKANKNHLQKANPDLREGSHPISRLFQIQQARKQMEPVFKVVKEEGKGRAKMFLVEVVVGDKTCTAFSTKIKTARLLATQNMLQLLGYIKAPSNAFSEEALTNVNNDTDNKLTIIDKNIDSLAAEAGSACPVEQLHYIASYLGFIVHFRNFPKTCEEGIVTLVSLPTVPPLHCHGEGFSEEESQRNAASNTIQQLAEFVGHGKVSMVTTTPAQEECALVYSEGKQEDMS